MNTKQIIPILAMLFLAMPLVSSEIIWSLPTGVEFSIGEPMPGLIMTVISPTDKTYTVRTIPIEVTTNIPAQCSYSLDNQHTVSLGSNTHFLSSVRLSNGQHTLTIKCLANSQEKTKTISFKVNCPEIQRNNTALEQDLIYENQINTPVYSEWYCINNRLQRTVTLRNLESIEYGGICGLSQQPQIEKNKSSCLWIFPIILLILILIILILITIKVARKK
jgi:hypothetical protein